jgi:hypothetical protein
MQDCDLVQQPTDIDEMPLKRQSVGAGTCNLTRTEMARGDARMVRQPLRFIGDLLQSSRLLRTRLAPAIFRFGHPPTTSL